MRPKYSIILPTLGGARTLAVTLPAMLRIDRDDVQWVISENHSDDDTFDLVRSIVADDDRVRVVRPAERLPLGKHLEFAYQQATGRWLSHLGDDDHLLPWRFDLLDQLLEQVGDDCSLIRGEYVRYNWPEYPESGVANSIDPGTFARSVTLHSGQDFARSMLNQSHVHGGGAWVVRSDIVQAVRRRCGYFASPQHVEFFAMRAAAALSRQVALVGLPLFILGRHAKSSGTQYFLPKESNAEQSWNWEFEDPDSYRYCPFNWKSYATLSLDGALTAQHMLAEELGDIAIDWRGWTKTIHSEMMRLVSYGQLPRAARNDFLQAVATVPAGSTLAWRWRTWRLAWQALFQRRHPSATLCEQPTITEGTISFLGRTLGGTAGFQSIVEVAPWLAESTARTICDAASLSYDGRHTEMNSSEACHAPSTLPDRAASRYIA